MFDPESMTSKHERQSEWKKVSLLMISGDIHKLYSWFMKKRYNLKLQYPIRGAHITFVNDRESETNGEWENVKNKWNGKEIDIILDVRPRGDGLNWWLNIPNEHRDEIHSIRAELGLGRPHFGLHMTIGTAVNSYPRVEEGINAQRALGMNEEHSQYILKLMIMESKKININKIRIIPGSDDLGFCVYGNPDVEILDWAKIWGFKIEEGDKYTNILVPKNFDISECFEDWIPYKYVDGFSPNLNKHLHVGHMSNFILAKTFQSMEVGEKFISILGDTVKGEVNHLDALNMYETYCDTFELEVCETFLASKMKYNGGKLKDGKGEYEGTKVFDTGEEKIVGIKSNGSTSYFYQDMALADTLNESTLYLTGREQDGHFGALNKFFPHTNHIGLGLVKIMVEEEVEEGEGETKKVVKKMSSRDGNVIYFSDLIEDCLKKFDNDWELVYNVLAGFIIKIEPKKDKKIDLEMLNNPKNSPGLYVSYTLARLTSAGVRAMKTETFNNNKLQFAFMKSLSNLNPSIFFNELIDHCKMINAMYGTHKIAGNPENEVMFSNFKEDLELGMKKLGLFLVDKV